MAFFDARSSSSRQICHLAILTISTKCDTVGKPLVCTVGPVYVQSLDWSRSVLKCMAPRAPSKNLHNARAALYNVTILYGGMSMGNGYYGYVKAK